MWRRAELFRTFADEPAEVHALVIGFRKGFRSRAWWVRTHSRPNNPDVQAEPHYFDGGHIAGAITQLFGWLLVLFTVVFALGLSV